MHPAARSRLSSMLMLLLLGCSGDPSGPNGGGTLAVMISGLPSGSAAAVSVSGPNGFAQSVTSSQTFTSLAPGSYTVTASGVTAGSTSYQASPSTQTVAVVSSGPQATASVSYSTATGDLALTINGLGTSRSAAVTVTGPGGYNQSVTTTRTLRGLVPGTYTVTAQNVSASCGSTYTASPANQNVSVVYAATAQATVSYNSPAGGVVNLCIDGMYVNQSAQSYMGTVPLVQNRTGLLRVFVVADRANTPAASVQVQVRLIPAIGTPTTVTLQPPAGLVFVPTAPDESSLDNSWNYVVPGSQLEPGLRIEAEVDPTDAVPESSNSDNIFAPPAPQTIRTMPTLSVMFVPILQKGIPLARRAAGNVTDGNKDQFLEHTLNMHPIASYDALINQQYTTLTSDTLESDNGNDAWGAILDEIRLMQLNSGNSRYYYGVVRVSYASGVAGVAYVSNPNTFPPQVARAALGWDDLPTGSVVAAHELGHNWARNHAPCGGPSGIDLNYPRPDGTTGSYGYNSRTGSLVPPTSTDIMGYCDSKWISEYTYSAVMNYLGSPSPLTQGGVASTAVQPSLLVWGHVKDGQLVLQPAFQVNTRPSLPSRSGPYSLQGRASDGSQVFNLSFAPDPIADARSTRQSFAFTIPLSDARASRLTSLHLSGSGRPAILTAAAAITPGQTRSQSGDIVVRRAGPGAVRLRWDARAHPMIMVRDTETGEVLSLARGGDAEFSTTKGQVELVMSDGVKSRVQRMVVAP